MCRSAILPPARRTSSDVLSEHVAEVRLVRESAGQRDFAQGGIAGQHEMNRPLQPAADDVCMRRRSEGALESPGKVRGTEAHDFTQPSYMNRLIEIFVYEGLNALSLPARET